jgi:ankyrin repeat protein
MWAAKYGYVDIAKVLVEAGADVNIQIHEEEYPFMEDEYYEYYSGYTALRYAEENDHTEVVKYLKSKGAK